MRREGSPLLSPWLLLGLSRFPPGLKPADTIIHSQASGTCEDPCHGQHVENAQPHE